MSMLSLYYRCRAVVRSLVNRRAVDREMRHEMDAHLAQAAERYAARGMSPREAREAARREFGNVAVLQEEGRDARSGQWLESVIADVRYAVRQIARRPLASVTIVFVLMLGIGVHAAIFAMGQSLTTNPAPGIEGSASLVRIRGKEMPPERGAWMPRLMSYPEFMDVASRSDLFERSAAWSSDNVTIDLGDPAAATSAQAIFITGDYFGTLGVRIARGTALPLPARADGSDGEMAAVISDAMWHGLFAEDPNIVGRTVTVNGTRVRIVGVAPRRFSGADAYGFENVMWLPLASRATVLRSTRQALLSRDSTMLFGAARLANGISIEKATTDVRVIAERAVAQMQPAADKAVRTSDVVPLRKSTLLPENPDLLINIIIMGVAGLLVLLVACTNVSALVIGSGLARRHEIAVRLSLGASRARLIRQLITESCVLAVLGGAAGLALFATIVRLGYRWFPDIEIEPNITTAAYTLLFALGTGILFGLSPALHATRRGVSEALKTGKAAGGAAGARLQSFFVAAQIAVTQPLLVGIAVMLAYALQMGNKPAADPVAKRVMRLRFYLQDETPERNARLRAAVRELEDMPGVVKTVRDAAGQQDVSLGVLPDSRAGLLRENPAGVKIEGIDPGYFGALDVKILRGRDVVLADTAARDMPIIIGDDYARELWGSADPIGRRFQQLARGNPLPRAAVVVGVFDTKRGTTRGEARRIYTIDPTDWRNFAFLVRTTVPASELTARMQAHLRSRLPDIAVPYMQTLEDRMAETRRVALMTGTGIGSAGMLVLMLASIGLYGVIGIAVAQRKREIGIRIALGANPSAVVGFMFMKGLRLALIGLVIGLPLSILAAGTLGQQLGATLDASTLGVPTPVIGVLIATAVLAVASLATWVPARRAAIVDPTTALRSE
jgi:predicted permease